MNNAAVRLVLGALVIAGAVAFGCGGDDDIDDGASPVTTPAGSESDAVTVTLGAVTGNSFDPGRISVEAGREFTIRFGNLDTIDHTFTIEGGPDTGPVSPGEIVSIPMEAGDSGTSQIFFCTIHGLGTMAGQIEYE
jgi:plastocyanin